MTGILRLSVLCMVALSPTLAAAPPALTYLYPAGGQQGKTVQVIAGGTFERWPVRAWVDGKGIAITAAKDKGKLAVSLAADAVPGVHWVRLYDDQGASALRPFIVGTLPEVLEQEPNDDPRKPQLLDSSTIVVNGRLSQPGDVDGFAVKLRKGQTLVASLEANRTLGSPMDASLQVVSADGFVLDQNDDYHGLDPQIVFPVPADGTYLVRTFAFPAVPDGSIRFAGGESYIYRLTLTTGGFVDHAYPLAVSRSQPGMVELFGWNLPGPAKKLSVGRGDEGDIVTLSHPQLANTANVRLELNVCAVETEPNDPRHAQPVALPVTISGRIDPPGDVGAYRFPAKKGQKLIFRVEAWSLGSPLDPVLRLTDTTGTLLTQVDDTAGREGNRDAELTFTAPQDGNFQIEVRDLHGNGSWRHVYRLRAALAEPDYELTVAADRFVLTPGKPLDIPVTVVRRNGFTGKVEITAEELPAGVTAMPVKLAGAAASAMLRLIVPVGPLSGPIRVTGKATGQEKRLRTARASLTGLNASTTSLWLTVLKSPPTRP